MLTSLTVLSCSGTPGARWTFSDPVPPTPSAAGGGKVYGLGYVGLDMPGLPIGVFSNGQP